MKNPRWPNKKTKKTQGEISIRFLQILGKDRLFPGKKPTSREKIPFYPLKILTTFFLVIDSHFQIFTRHFQISSQKLLPNSFKFVTFSRKTLNSCIFS